MFLRRYVNFYHYFIKDKSFWTQGRCNTQARAVVRKRNITKFRRDFKKPSCFYSILLSYLVKRKKMITIKHLVYVDNPYTNIQSNDESFQIKIQKLSIKIS